jgi:thioredoxin reductase (NADPH)
VLETLIYIAAGLIAVGVPVLYISLEKRKSARAAETLRKAIERGLDEPVSLHPFIDPAICIGTAACVTACPEVNVLGIIDNRGKLISPAKCIGHGLCQAACPVDAITLVFGTEKRGVDIPFIKGNFETNVPGVYVAGELGGMGLIRNAVTQGKEAAHFIADGLSGQRSGEVLDLIIIGAGPAGVAAALQAKVEKLNFLLLDQEDLGGTILSYPRQKLVMTQPMELPLYGKVTARELRKEQLIDIFTDVFAKTGLRVQSGEKVETVERAEQVFHIISTRGRYVTRRVLLAIGRRGSPRKLGVPGEKSDKVSYRLLDPEKFHDQHILVVGGGDSAVEAALALAEQPQTTVHLSYRRESLFRIKEGNEQRITEAFKLRTVVPLFNSAVTEIQKDEVILEQQERKIVLPNQYIFVFAGGELPADFLKKIGIEFTRKFGQA